MEAPMMNYLIIKLNSKRLTPTSSPMTLSQSTSRLHRSGGEYVTILHQNR